MKTQTVYTPIDVNERLPKKEMGYFTYQEDYFIGEKIDQSLDAQMFENGIFEVEDKYYAQPSHWLEKKENQIVLSKDEFRKQIENAFEAGIFWESYVFDCESWDNQPSKPVDKEIYINNLLNNER